VEQAARAEQPRGEGEDDEIDAVGAAGLVPEGSVVPGLSGGDVKPALLLDAEGDQVTVAEEDDALGGGAVGVPAWARSFGAEREGEHVAL